MKFDLSKFYSSIRYIDISDIHAFIISEVQKTDFDYYKKSFSQAIKQNIKDLVTILEKDHSICDIDKDKELIEKLKNTLIEKNKTIKKLQHNVSQLQLKLNKINQK